MSHLLHVASSGRQAASLSLRAAERVISDLSPTTITVRDLTTTTLPFVSTHWAARPSPTPQDTLKFTVSDTLIGELLTADILLISTPMYNLGIPASLKAWFDLICRPALTFDDLPRGPVGLLQNKRGIIVVASGGVPIDGPADLATPYLRQVLHFLGISDVTTINAGDMIV